jgi:pterin-4a-carbinolamine dehydratase
VLKGQPWAACCLLLRVQALELFQRVGQVAEAEGHHPDLHLEGELPALDCTTHGTGIMYELSLLCAVASMW